MKVWENLARVPTVLIFSFSQTSIRVSVKQLDYELEISIAQ